MAIVLSQELDPNDKLKNLLDGDNVENKRRKADGTVEDIKRNSIMEEAYDAVIKNEDFQKEAAAIYKTDGGRKFDKTGDGSLDNLFDTYLHKTDIYKNLESQKATDLDLLVLSTGLELSMLMTNIKNIKNDMDNIDLTGSDRSVFNTIQEIANQKVQNNNGSSSLAHNGIGSGNGTGSGNGNNGNGSLAHNGIDNNNNKHDDNTPSDGSHRENTKVNYHDEKNPDGTMKIGTTSFGTKSTEKGHDEYELAKYGAGDTRYSPIDYADGFVSKNQAKRNAKDEEEFDPSSNKKMKYKNKDIEYRDKNKQVYDAVLTIMKDFKKIDKNGEEGALALKDVRGLDWTKIPDILYLITRDDRMKEHNSQHHDDESTGNDLSAWKNFVNDSNDGVSITPDKEKEFKRLLKGIDYKGINIHKLISFLNMFSNVDTIPYINKIVDIGERKGKSGRMQLIETSNVGKLIDKVTATDESEETFKGDTWKEKVKEMRGGDNANKTAENDSIESVEKAGNFFAFLSDLNNDGRVDQYDVGSSMTGFEFHNMLTSICDVKKSDDKFEIINGPQTSTVLRNMLEKAYSVSHNVNLRSDIKSLLDSTSFLHTYHVFELIKKYPEIKPYMIYDIQAETEYSQKNRKIKNTYEAFNPDAANSLTGDKNSDPIEDYFTSEAIKDAMGDLHKTSIDKLKAIANAEGITLNRKVDVDVIKAMNVLVSTLFMNFGPLMRAMQFDRLHSNQNDPAHAMQYNYGNAQGAIEGKIPLSKEDLQRPWNGQETKEFIKSAGFKKWLQTTSINPMIGISTYADAEGNMKPSPVLGIGISFDKTKLDPSQKRAHHFTQVGVAFDVMDMQLFAGLNGSNVRQVNNKNLKDNLDTRKPYVKGLGMQYGVGGALDIKNPLQSGLFANVGPLYEVDHLAGLDQVSRNFETFLSPFTKPIDAKFLTAKLSNDSDRDKLYIDLENSYLSKFDAKYKEPKYLHLTESSIHMFVGHLQEQRLLENLGNHDLPISDKQKIIQAYMGQRIDGFVSTLYQTELAKLNTKGLKLSAIGAKIGANLTVESLLKGGPIGVLFSANLKFSAHNEIYGDDPNDINSVSKQLDYGAGMESLNITPGTSLEVVAKKLERSFAISDLAIAADESAGTLTFTNAKGGSVLNLLHLYYTEDALKNAGFTFDGETLVVGNVGTIGIANVLKGMSKAHYLILGSDKMIGCLEYNKYKEKKGAKKGDKSTYTWNPLQPKNKEGEVIDASGITGMKQEKVKVLPTLEDIKKQVAALGNVPNKDILPYLKGVNTQGELLLNIPKFGEHTINIPYKTNAERYVPATGTLSFRKYKGVIEVEYESTPNDKLVIKHKTRNAETTPTMVIDKKETVKINLDAKELFANARTVLEENKVLIKTFDNVNKDVVLKFLAAAKNIDGNGIDHTDYVSSLSSIKDKLSKHVHNDVFTKLLENTKDEELVYIVNRLKAIFAENYTFKSAADVHKELKRRGNTYANILGPSQSKIPNEIAAIREGFKTHNGATSISERTDLLGYTAWYRNGGQSKDARGYSSTAYGHTNVLDGFIQEIPDKKETHQWMIDGLKKDQRNLDIMAKTINKSLVGKGVSITANNLLEILQKGQTAIDKTNKILKLNVKWYFYLLGECANESVGLALDGDATIVTTKPDDDSKYDIKETSITPTEKISYKFNASKTTKTIDMDVKGKKADINFAGQGGVQVGKWGEKGGQGNEEVTGQQGGGEDPVGPGSGGQGGGELETP